MPAILLTIIGSRIGQLALAFIVGWTLAWWKTDAGWRETVAAEKAAVEAQYQAELSRQRAASAEIAEAAKDRIEYEATRAKDMAARIRELELLEARHEPTNPIKLQCKNAAGSIAPVIVRPCRLDRRDVEFMRGLDAPNAAKSAIPAKHIR